jgi:hypothetical protein
MTGRCCLYIKITPPGSRPGKRGEQAHRECIAQISNWKCINTQRSFCRSLVTLASRSHMTACGCLLDLRSSVNSMREQ